MLRVWVFVLICLIPYSHLKGAIASESQHLKITDVRNIVEEMLSYHIETKDVSPLLIIRSIKMFIEQFDPKKSYLIFSEVEPYLFHLNSATLEQAVDSFYKDEYPLFEKVNQTIEKAIRRARKWRTEFYRDFIETRGNLTIEPTDPSFQYVHTLEQLKKRIKSNMLRAFLRENHKQEGDFWNEKRCKKICSLFEKRAAIQEQAYLSDCREREDRLATHIIKSVARSLDAHTAFFDKEEAYEIKSCLEKQFDGIGIGLREGLDGIEISNIIKGSPAERSGQVQVGDSIVEIDGTPTEDLSYQDLLERLKGTVNQPVSLGLMRREKNGELIRIDLKRERILMEEDRVGLAYKPFMDGIIGILKLSSFYESGGSLSCEADLKNGLRELKKNGKLLGLILDMRENLGGFLSQAIKVTSLFITSGIVAISKYAQGEVQYIRNLDPRTYYDGPLIVLTSKLSASATEIVAQALQDYGIALVIGDKRTYGKGTIQYQTITNSQAFSFFKVTIGKYYTVSGRSTQISGVKADIVVPSLFAHYPIGEKYLEYALPNDRVSSIYSDSLSDIPQPNHLWFRNNYLPFLQKKETRWNLLLPELLSKSSDRIQKNPDFRKIDEMRDGLTQAVPYDLQQEEVINILKDMIQLNS